MNRGIERSLQKLNVEYDVFFYQFTDWEKDEDFCIKLEERLKSGKYSRVFSVNFAPLIAEVCHKMQISYLSWIYDSPLHIRDLRPLRYSCNTIYFFDRMQARAYQKEGINARHLPLAVDTEVFRVNPNSTQKKKYGADVSLVGKLYQTDYQYYLQPLNAYQRGYLEGIIQSQLKIYGGYLIPELITKELLQDLNKSYAAASNHKVQITERELEFMLACETTGRERYLALALLSGHFATKIYSNQEDERLAKAKFMGYADYYTEMPYIFQLSNINLNITLKTIQTGIPLRVIDVMGCGGFVLSNYQEELAEYFQNEKECVIYESLEDMFDKAKFYLTHESERKRIATNALQKVKTDFTFEQRMAQIF